MKVLQKWNSVIEYKIQCKDLKNFQEVEFELSQLNEKLNEAYGNFTVKDELFANFKVKVLAFSGDYFNNQAKLEIDHMKNENTQITEKYHNEINDLKQLYDSEMNKKVNELNSLKTENTEFKEQIEQLNETTSFLNKDKEILERSLVDKNNLLKEDYEGKINDLTQKLNIALEKQKDAERKLVTYQCDFDREKALLEQKIDYYNKQMEENTKREKGSGQEIKSQLKEQGLAMKDMTSKFETQIKNLNKLNEDLNEKILEFESSLYNKEQIIENEKSKIEEINKKFVSEISEYKSSLDKLKSKCEIDK